MLICLYYWESKSNLFLVTYTILTKILICVQTDIPTSCYIYTYPDDTLANYVYDKDR